MGARWWGNRQLLGEHSGRETTVGPNQECHSWRERGCMVLSTAPQAVLLRQPLLKTEIALIEHRMTTPLWNVISQPFGTSADPPKTQSVSCFLFVRKTCFSVFLLQEELLRNKALEVLLPFPLTQVFSVHSSWPSECECGVCWRKGWSMAVWECSLFPHWRSPCNQCWPERLSLWTTGFAWP